MPAVRRREVTTPRASSLRARRRSCCTTAWINLVRCAPTFGYDPWGNALQATAPLTDFGYAGMFTNADSGLRLTLYRAYDPVAGRWLSRDPLEEKSDTVANLYRYVEGNPLSRIDETGRSAFSEGFNEAMCLLGFPCRPSGPAWCPLPTAMQPPANAWPPNGPKAPGYPGDPNTGHPDYKDPKGGPDWVPNPNGPGYGWEDKRGDVWVPTGPTDPSKGISHGGPHWDVQNPITGGRTNKFPPP